MELEVKFDALDAPDGSLGAGTVVRTDCSRSGVALLGQMEAAMSGGHYNVLFLSARNTARSIFAEAAMNRMGRGNFRGFSAGMQPADHLDPMVQDILQVAQYPTESLHPKHWKDFVGADAPSLDFVFTLCDATAGEPLPHWPGRPVTADWRYPDPARLPGETWQRRKDLAAMLAGTRATA